MAGFYTDLPIIAFTS